MTIPSICGMPPLLANVEGLRHHAFLCMFLTEDISAEKYKWRAWLVHMLVKAARHYDDARDMIEGQIRSTAADGSQGAPLPILDFSFAMEDCITSISKACQCLGALNAKVDASVGNRVLALVDERAILQKVRNQQEHMFSQISSGETGKGPIFLAPSKDGEHVLFRSLAMPFADVHRLIEAVYLDISMLAPNFDPASARVAPGVMTLKATATIEQVERQSS